MFERKEKGFSTILQYIRQLSLSDTEVNLKSLCELTKEKEYVIFAYLCALYHRKLIEVDNIEFYKHPVDRVEFKIWLSPAGYEALIDIGSV